MASKECTIIVPQEQVNRFEAALDATSIFTTIYYKKIKDGNYIFEGSLAHIELLVKNFGSGTILITNSNIYFSSAIVRMSNTISVNIDNSTRDEVMSTVSYLNREYQLEWVIVHLVEYDSNEDYHTYIYSDEDDGCIYSNEEYDEYI